MAGIKFSISGGLNNDVFGKSLAPIMSFLEKRDEAAVRHQMYSKIFKEVHSTHYGEKYTALTAMSDFEPTPEGGTIPSMEMQEGFGKTIENVQWTGKFTVTKRAMKEGLLIDLQQRPQQFIDAYHRAKENHAAALIGGAINGLSSMKQGYYSFDLTSADGRTLFNTAHPSAISRKTLSQSNSFTNSFSISALEAVSTEMQNFRGDQGETLDISPDTILIPNIGSLKTAVFSALGADKSPETTNNGYNYGYGMWNVLVWPALNKYVSAGTSPWILLDSKYIQRTNALVFQNRQDLEVDVFMSPNNKDTEWIGDAVFAGGFIDWRGIACGGVSGGTTLS